MKLYSVLIFIFVFTIEVRLRAFDSVEEKILETPEKCLHSKEYCIIKNLKDKFFYTNESYSFSMAPEAIVVRQKEYELSFVKGELFFKTKNKNVTLEIPYGQIDIDKNTQVIFQKMADKVVVQTIFGKVFLKPLGDKKQILVMQGHENYISAVSESLKAQTGIPKPILVEQMLKSWAYHSNTTKENFLKEVQSFKDVHETAVKDLSILNEQIASREIASIKAEKLANEARQKREKERQQEMQKAYYNRLLGE